MPPTINAPTGSRSIDAVQITTSFRYRCFLDLRTSVAYKSYNTELIIPAEITDEQKTAIREYGLRIFKAIGGRGLSRVDFFVDGDSVIFNEINTMPGFTSGSMYPLLMTGENENISDLIDSILMNEI